MRIALYFGSFNPIHKGHIAISEYILNGDFCDEIWLVISPQNPFKKAHTLANEIDRFEMASMAVNRSRYKDRIIVSNIEFELQKPSYTINTLMYLKNKFPNHQFSIIMGEDNLNTFSKWKNWKEIINNHRLLVYPRADRGNTQLSEHFNVLIMANAPQYCINSSQIRDLVKIGANIDELSTNEVVEYIKINKLYE